ncbi:MAG: hypothetical protein ACR2FY_19135 [Pirellulaceae bacterium]
MVEILGTKLSGFVYLGNLRAYATWSHSDGIVAVQLKTRDLTTAHLIELRQLRASSRPMPIGIPGTKKYRGSIIGFENDPEGFTLHIAKAA